MTHIRDPLPDGEYRATCKERNDLAAALNGHAAVYPRARMTVDRGTAIFHRDGETLWTCDVVYAAAHFRIDRV
ncbi:hypothetical protein FPJ27_26400 [Burkholderia sp. MS455]|uniref:hypothetical protein n=1 Tax=Burkholderia sp. MS455 TaxID=2811788 RepID=UPI00195A70DF|nr:hypothetical protein [Burkholderia sp. MS455]QRR09761.1 hypothetical protein FPJ27_26400 [Burkholderia sp. MS455]